MVHVDMTEDNKRHCRCPVCPVETASQCSLKKLEEINQGGDPQSNDLPEVYCSHGESNCKDMKAQENCLCPSCLVWEENDLSNNHYCVKDSADKIN